MIDLYLITGFLGSGKTTFLKQLLEQNNEKKIGVIVNEFGSAGIDGKILKKKDMTMVEINNGSIFCACLKGGFVKALVELLQQPIEVLFIEASGMADPSSMKNLLEQLTVLLKQRPEIVQQYNYKGSICLIDAERFLDFCDMFVPTINQVKKSSLLILNKIDDVSKEDVKELHTKLYDLNDKAYIYDTTFGKVPIDLLHSKVSPEGVFESETTNSVLNRPATYILTMEKTYDLDKMKEFAMQMSDKVIRLKGFFMSTDGHMVHADCVGDYIKIKPLDEDRIEIGSSCELVLIGKDSSDYEGQVIAAWEYFFPEKELICVKN